MLVPGFGKPSLYAWQAWASSNSGPYLLLARFQTPAQAQAICAEIEELYEQFLEFANSEDYQAWMDTNYYEATPQMQEWAKARGFTWPKEDGFAWEEVEEPP